MADNNLPPMAHGGEWLQSSADREPHYVVHEAHIKRLKSEGWQPAADPRKPREAKAASPSRDDALAAALARIAALEAQIAQPAATSSAPTEQAASDQESSGDSGKSRRKG